MKKLYSFLAFALFFLSCAGLFAQTTYSETPGAPIDPGSGGQTYTSTITVSGGTTSITDIDVGVDITHTWAGDIDIDLTSPAGTTVRIMDDGAVNSSSDDVVVTMDDAAATPHNTNMGTIQPANPLSAFNGEDANGTWTMVVTDDAGGDGGTWNSWSMMITGAAGIPTLSEWGLIILTLLVLNIGTVRLLRLEGQTA